RAVDLDLQAVRAIARPAVMRGREAPGIGHVARDAVALGGNAAIRRLDDLGMAGGAMTVAQHEVGGDAPSPLAAAAARRHRMAIEEEVIAETQARCLEELP